MSAKLRLLALAAGLLIPAATALAASPDGSPGYFDEAGAPLVGPTEYDTGSGADTLARQKASGYFDEADAPLVAPNTQDGDASQTPGKQRASGYFPEADAPLVSPTTSVH